MLQESAEIFATQEHAWEFEGESPESLAEYL